MAARHTPQPRDGSHLRDRLTQAATALDSVLLHDRADLMLVRITTWCDHYLQHPPLSLSDTQRVRTILAQVERWLAH